MEVENIIAQHLNIDVSEVTDDKHLMEDLGADSLDTVELVMALEEEFDIEISDEEAENISTVQTAIDYINKSPD